MRLGQGSGLSQEPASPSGPWSSAAEGQLETRRQGLLPAGSEGVSAWGKCLGGTREHGGCGGCGAQRSQGIQTCHKSHHGAFDHLGVS